MERRTAFEKRVAEASLLGAPLSARQDEVQDEPPSLIIQKQDRVGVTRFKRNKNGFT